jgi:hypothetical protein
MTYDAWRISFQSDAHAARATFDELDRLQALTNQYAEEAASSALKLDACQRELAASGVKTELKRRVAELEPQLVVAEKERLDAEESLRKMADFIHEQRIKLDGAVSFRHRPESDEWQADFGDHHALGKTKERAIFELGMYLMRREAK